MATREQFPTETKREVNAVEGLLFYGIVHGSSERMPELDDESIQLVVTTYP